MGENSSIEWCDHSWNPWLGCSRVSEGCVNCYAETLMDYRYGKVQWGPQGERKRTSETYWRKPHQWNKARWYQCGACGWRGDFKQTIWSVPRGVLCPDCQSDKMQETRQRVFCGSLCDVFEDKPNQAEDLTAWRADLWRIIEGTPNLDWLLLTKRPENVNDMVPAWWRNVGRWPANVWVGTSVEDQESADKRIPELLKIPARVRFLSCEPLLAPIRIRPHLTNRLQYDFPVTAYGEAKESTTERIHWVIVGGESGPNARECNMQWISDIVDQCWLAYVPVFVKQLGSHPYDGETAGGDQRSWPITDRKGGDINEFPEELQVREFPTARVQAEV